MIVLIAENLWLLLLAAFFGSIIVGEIDMWEEDYLRQPERKMKK